MENIKENVKLYRIGIDPGSTGSLVALDIDNYEIKYSIKFDSGRPAYKQLYDFLMKNKDQIKIVTIENVHSIFGASAKSNFTFGKNVGKVEAIVELSGVPYQLVPPKEWQKKHFTGLNPKTKAKIKSKMIFDRLFPKHIDITHSGIVDASLISLMG